jgi:hypothetical protein
MSRKEEGEQTTLRQNNNLLEGLVEITSSRQAQFWMIHGPRWFQESWVYNWLSLFRIKGWTMDARRANLWCHHALWPFKPCYSTLSNSGTEGLCWDKRPARNTLTWATWMFVSKS